MKAMLNALRAGHLKGLEKLILWEVSSYNQITTSEEGTDTIADALTAGNLPVLHTMDFTGSLPKLIPARKLSIAMKELLFRCSCGTGRLLEGLQICMGCLFCTIGPEKNQTLECLRCSCGALQVSSGNDGLRKIARAVDNTPMDSLRVLRLQHNYIGDKGASSIAKILRRGVVGRWFPSLQQKKMVLKRTVGIIRIYITSTSCGFLGAAKALGNQSEGRDTQRKRLWLPEWLGGKFRRKFWPWQSRRKTIRQMYSIKPELLMMAERKPDEFYSMFGLRQVLLQNRSCNDKYSRVWMCRSCFLGYSRVHAVMHPITTDDEVGVSSHLDQLHREPEPEPSAHLATDVSNQ